MRKFQTCILLAGLVLSACVNVVPQSSTSAPPAFITSTLPPTRPALVLPTGTQVTSTPDPSTTTTPGAESTSHARDRIDRGRFRRLQGQRGHDRRCDRP